MIFGGRLTRKELGIAAELYKHLVWGTRAQNDASISSLDQDLDALGLRSDVSQETAKWAVAFLTVEARS